MPIKRDFKKFDPVQVGHLDAAMWRSYYEKRSVKLFLQLGELIRSQFHAPVVRSYLMAYYSGKAAFVFKKGTNREEYLKALPYLIRYFKALQNISDTPLIMRPWPKRNWSGGSYAANRKNTTQKIGKYCWVVQRRRCTIYPPIDLALMLINE